VAASRQHRDGKLPWCDAVRLHGHRSASKRVRNGEGQAGQSVRQPGGGQRTGLMSGRWRMAASDRPGSRTPFSAFSSCAKWSWRVRLRYSSEVSGLAVFQARLWSPS
jgi:hypothetical protein